jgi:hypothetical protein
LFASSTISEKEEEKRSFPFFFFLFSRALCVSGDNGVAARKQDNEPGRSILDIENVENIVYTFAIERLQLFSFFFFISALVTAIFLQNCYTISK